MKNNMKDQAKTGMQDSTEVLSTPVEQPDYINVKNTDSLIRAKKEYIDIVDNPTLRDFIEIFKERSSGKINENTPYLVFSLKSISLLEELNNLFTINGINAHNLYKNRMSIEISNKVPLADINKIRVIKENDFKTVYEQRELLVNTIEKKLKPELINLLPTPKVQENITKCSHNVDGSIANIELTWYYKNLLNWKVDLYETIYYEHNKFTIFDSRVAKSLPVTSSTILYREKAFDRYTVVKKAPSIEGFRHTLLDVRIIHDYDDASRLYTTFKAFQNTWLTMEKRDEDLETLAYSTSREIIKYMSKSLRNTVQEFISNEGAQLLNNAPSFSSNISRTFACCNAILDQVDELRATSAPLSILYVEKIACLLKEIDFALFDVFSHINRTKKYSYLSGLDDEIEISKAICFIKKMINDFLDFIGVYEAYWTPDYTKSKIAFNPENDKWLFRKSLALKPEFKKLPLGVNDLYKGIFFRFAGIIDKDRDELIKEHGISYLAEIVPVYYSVLADSLNLMKTYLINLEIILHNNSDLNRQLRLDNESCYLIDKFFENYLDTVKLLKTSVCNLLKNTYIISSPSISVSKDDLMKFKMYVDENLNIARQFVDSNILNEIVAFNSKTLVKVQLKKVQQTTLDITSLVEFIKNASIGMCVTLNTMIATQDLYAKVKKTTEFKEGDSTMDLLKTARKIHCNRKIRVRYSANIANINQFNWYDSDRVFDSRVKTVIEEKILDFYSHLDKLSVNFDVRKNIQESKVFFEKWWNVYLTEQGIAKDLEQLSKIADDLANEEYLNFIFAKTKADKYYRNLALDFDENENLYEGMLNAKLGVFHIYSGKSRIYKALLSHRRRAQWAFGKLAEAFGDPESFIQLKKWVEEWFSKANGLIQKVYAKAVNSTDPKVLKVAELMDIHDRVATIDEIKRLKDFKDEIPKTIFAGFGPREVMKFGLTTDIVPVKEVTYIQDSIADNFDKSQKVFDKQFNNVVKQAKPQEQEMKKQVLDFTYNLILSDKMPNECIPFAKTYLEDFGYEDVLQQCLKAVEEQKSIEDVLDSVFGVVTKEELHEDHVEEIHEINEEAFEGMESEVEYRFCPTIVEFQEQWLLDGPDFDPLSVIHSHKRPMIISYQLLEPEIDPNAIVTPLPEPQPVVEKITEEVIEIPFFEEIVEEKVEEVIEEPVVEEVQEITVYINEKPITTHYCFSYDEFPDVIDSQSKDRYVLIKLEEEPVQEIIVEEFIEEPVVEEEPVEEIIEEVVLDKEEIKYLFENDNVEDEVIEEPVIILDPVEVIEEVITEEPIVEEVVEEVIEEIIEEPVEEIIEEVVEDIPTVVEEISEELPIEEDFEKEYVYADPTPLTDAEMMMCAPHQPKDIIEYVYADDKLLTDKEMLASVDIVECYSLTPTDEVVNTVVDESAPYADEIKEVYDEDIVEEIIEDAIIEEAVEEAVEEFIEETVEEAIQEVVEEEIPVLVEETTEELPIEEEDFEKEYVYADETPLTDAEMMYVEPVSKDIIEYVYAEDTLLTDEEMMFNVEIIEWDGQEATEEVVDTVVDESAPYADPIREVYEEPTEETEQELVEETTEEEFPVEEPTEELVDDSAVEYITASEEQLADDELITEESVEPQDEIEYIYADETPLTDEEMMFSVEINESEPVEEESVIEEVNTVVDESAPYADEIKEVYDEDLVEESVEEEIAEEPTEEEVYFEEELPTEELVDDSTVEYITASEEQLADDELITEEPVEPQDEIEYIYADETPLTDEEMMFFVEINESEPVEEKSVVEEVNTVVDESAPYADEIKEVYDEDLVEESVEEEPVLFEEETPVEEVTEETEQEFEDLSIYNEDEVTEEPVEETVEEEFTEEQPEEASFESELPVEEEIIEEPVEEELEDFSEYESNLEQEFADLTIYNEEETEEVLFEEETPVEEEITEEPTEEESVEEELPTEEETPVEEDFEKEYIYADETPLTDEEMMFCEEVQQDVTEQEPVEEEVNTVVDESAPYADEIKEVYDEDLVEESVEEEITEEPTEEEVYFEEELPTEEDLTDDVDYSEKEYIYADETPLTDEEMMFTEEVQPEVNEEEVVQEEVNTVVDESAPYADEIQEVYEDELPVEEEITEEVVEEPTEELVEDEYNTDDVVDQEIPTEQELPTDQEIQPTVYINPSNTVSFDLAEPTASEESLDWSKLDAESHIMTVETPLFVKVFKVNE